jgi:hypothetical protein
MTNRRTFLATVAAAMAAPLAAAAEPPAIDVYLELT